MKRIIVIGASSGIGEGLVRKLTGSESRVALAARRVERLEKIASDLNGDGIERARVYPHDVRQFETIDATFRSMVDFLGGVDCVIVAAGIMPVDLKEQFDLETEVDVLNVNTVGSVGWLSTAGLYFEAQGRGTLVAIGSVAGDRGRFGFPSYCASKAAIDTYMEGLRHRFARLPIRVLTIKPGPIETEMTSAMNATGCAPLEPSIDRMVRAIMRRDGVIYVPWKWHPIMLIIRHLPWFIFRRMRI